MSATRLMTGVTLLVIVLSLMSCEFSQGSKVSKKGVATEDTALVARLEAALTKAGVSYEVGNTQDGLLSVTWDAANDDKANSILRSVSGLAPENTSTLCFFAAARFDDFTLTLQQHDIPFETTRPNSEEWCARWEDKYDDEVATVDSDWRDIRELEKRQRGGRH